MGPRLLKTQLTHRLGRTDSYDNLYSLRMPIYNSLVSLDDGQEDGQAHQITQVSNTFEQPPGAEITQLTTLDHPRQAGNLFLRPTAGHYPDYSSPEPSPHAFYSQSGGSDASLSAPSASHSSSPVPSASHVFQTSRSFVRKS